MGECTSPRGEDASIKVQVFSLRYRRACIEAPAVRRNAMTSSTDTHVNLKKGSRKLTLATHWWCFASTSPSFSSMAVSHGVHIGSTQPKRAQCDRDVSSFALRHHVPTEFNWQRLSGGMDMSR